MSSRSAAPTAVPASATERWGSRSGPDRRAAGDDASRLPRTALAYAARCHARQRRESDGAPFVEHLSEVARLLRDAGCSDVVVAAGLLHAVMQDAEVGETELSARFGVAVSGLVAVMTDRCVGSYPQRMQNLREQVAEAGGDAALLFAADEIAELRELSAQVRREPARGGRVAGADRARDRYRRLRLEQHHASLEMLRGVAPEHRLVRQLAGELRACPLTRGPQRSTAGRS